MRGKIGQINIMQTTQGIPNLLSFPRIKLETGFFLTEGIAKKPAMKKRDGIKNPSKNAVIKASPILASSVTGHQSDQLYAMLACCNTTPNTNINLRLSKKLIRPSECEDIDGFFIAAM